MRKDSFVLYTKINEVVRELTYEQKGKLFQAILDYEETGEQPELDQILRLVFIPIKQDLDRNNEKWEARSRARSEAGKKGMASRYGKAQTTEPNKTEETTTATGRSNGGNGVSGVITGDNNKQQTLTNTTDNVNVNENVNENVGADEDVNVNESNTPPSSPASGGGDAEPREKPPDLQEQRFDAFWKLYPKKQGKGAALKAWKKIKPDKALFEKIMAAVRDNLDRNQQWRRDNGQYIPNPSTWLNQQRWLDELQNQQRGGADNAAGRTDGADRQRIGGADNPAEFQRSTGFRSADSGTADDG